MQTHIGSSATPPTQCTKHKPKHKPKKHELDFLYANPRSLHIIMKFGI
jgi:hypothetical protein